MLSEASSEKIFGNISELIEVSCDNIIKSTTIYCSFFPNYQLTLSIAKDLLNLFERRSANNIAKPTELILAFRMVYNLIFIYIYQSIYLSIYLFSLATILTQFINVFVLIMNNNEVMLKVLRRLFNIKNTLEYGRT